MVFSGVLLILDTTHCRLIGANKNKEIFCIESKRLIMDNDFDMCQVLDIRTDLILALNNQYSIWTQYAMGLFSSLEVEIKHRFVVFWSFSCWFSI